MKALVNPFNHFSNDLTAPLEHEKDTELLKRIWNWNLSNKMSKSKETHSLT